MLERVETELVHPQEIVPSFHPSPSGKSSSGTNINKSHYSLTPVHKALSLHTLELLDTRTVGGSSSELAWSCLLGLLHAGYDTVDILQMYTDHPGLQHYVHGRRAKGRSAEQRRKYVIAEVRRAKRWLADNPINGDAADLTAFGQAVLDAVQVRPHLFKGISGNTDRVILRALVAVMIEAGRYEFGASSRKLSEIALVRHQTVLASVDRLLIDGLFLARTAEGKHGYSARYRLKVPADDDVIDVHVTSPPLSGPVHEIFAGPNLGPGVERTYEALAHPLTVRDLATLTGRTPSTVRGHLKRLSELRLATQLNGRWHRNEAALTAAEQSGSLPGHTQIKPVRKWIENSNHADRQAFTPWLTGFQDARGSSQRWAKIQARAHRDQHEISGRNLIDPDGRIVARFDINWRPLSSSDAR